MSSRDDVPLVDPAHWFFRLPVIRHVRAMWHAEHVDRHNRLWRSIGAIPDSDFDERVLRQIWRGIV